MKLLYTLVPVVMLILAFICEALFHAYINRTINERIDTTKWSKLFHSFNVFYQLLLIISVILLTLGIEPISISDTVSDITIICIYVASFRYAIFSIARNYALDQPINYIGNTCNSDIYYNKFFKKYVPSELVVLLKVLILIAVITAIMTGALM